ncbi:MAG: hypothetical protein K0U72_16020 [Gammaproteobacteria bacterium]|nr:hypothetical protein [Gammaproteobacteria bacterium]
MTQKQSWFALVAILVLAGWCYSTSFSSDFQLDDEANLDSLALVSDAESALEFVATGIAGPTGRPLSLLTFALQADSWSDGPAAFLLVNTFIHLLNALLLALIVRGIFMLRGENATRATYIAFAATSVWVLLPLISTATLLVIQRMTSLSAFFVLVGLAGYIQLRPSAEDATRGRLAILALWLGAATVLATFSKESGALLPVFILVIETTLLRPPLGVRGRDWQTWCAVMLWLPFIALVGYLVLSTSYAEAMVWRRGFDSGERLLTQAHILWVYLGKALVGSTRSLGVYQGDYEIVRSLFSPATLLAVGSWLAVIVLAIVRRRRFPLFAFAVLWFVAGHLLESTVLPLELYFEHRNYIAIAGPIVAFMAFLITHSEQSQSAARYVIPLLIVVNAWFLFSIASLQGSPSVAARYWGQTYPDSVRAVTNMAKYQLIEEGFAPALDTLADFSDRHSEHRYLRILELNLECLSDPTLVTPSRVQDVKTQLVDSGFDYLAGELLSALLTTSERGQCTAVPVEKVAELAEALYANPRYSRDPTYSQIHYGLLALIARISGDNGRAFQHLEQAITFGLTEDLVTMSAVTMIDNGEFAPARAFLADAEQKAPWQPLQAMRWQLNIDANLAYLKASELQQQRTQ